MRRRGFLMLAAGAAVAWPSCARTQQSSAPVPVVGFLRTTPSAPFTHLLAALREGLSEAGFVDGRTVTIEQRYADNQYDRVSALAADLAHRRAAVIIANAPAVPAAKPVIGTIPIVFVTGDDPIKSGLVTNLSRPEGNLTGITFFGGGQLNAKRLELLHELTPNARPIAALFDSTYPAAEVEVPNTIAASRVLGRPIEVVKVAGESEFESAFARFVQAGVGALLVSGSPLFTSRRGVLIALAARHGVPAIYDQRDFVADGGLLSYGASIASAYRQAGIYAARILKGTKPSELPVVQPTTFELALNLKTAKALNLSVPQSVLLRADEVIE